MSEQQRAELIEAGFTEEEADYYDFAFARASHATAEMLSIAFEVKKRQEKQDRIAKRKARS